MIKQWINIMPSGTQDLGLKYKVKAEMAKILKWVQHKLGTSFPLQQKQAAQRGPKRSRG